MLAALDVVHSGNIKMDVQLLSWNFAVFENILMALLYFCWDKKEGAYLCPFFVDDQGAWNRRLDRFIHVQLSVPNTTGQWGLKNVCICICILYFVFWICIWMASRGSLPFWMGSETCQSVASHGQESPKREWTLDKVSTFSFFRSENKGREKRKRLHRGWKMSISSQAWTDSAAGLTVRPSWTTPTTVTTSLVFLILYFCILYLYFVCWEYTRVPTCITAGLTVRLGRHQQQSQP